MGIWRHARVIKILIQRAGYTQVEVEVITAPLNSSYDFKPGFVCRAAALTKLTGEIELNDVLLIEISALALKLGTGGLASVAGVINRLPADQIPNGHIMKARYTASQLPVMAADEQGSPWHAVLKDAQSVKGLTVVAADLHSALYPIICGIRAYNLNAKIAVLVTDGGALPLAWSSTLADLENRGWIKATISTGQSFGGTYEAVNVYSGILVAKLVVNADIAIITQGPGNLGTDTKWGFSGTTIGEAINAAAILEANCVASVRMSNGDKRSRHRGLSHHSFTTYSQICHYPFTLPIPALEDLKTKKYLSVAELEILEADLQRLTNLGLAKLQQWPLAKILAILENALTSDGICFKTMGRGLFEDPLNFAAATAAGLCAGGFIDK